MSSQEKNKTVDIAGSFKDALIGAGITFLLCLGIVSLKITYAGGSKLTLESRWHYVLIAVSVIFVARLILNLLWWKRYEPLRLFDGMKRTGAWRKSDILQFLSKYGIPVLIILMVVFAFLFPVSPLADRRYLTVGINILTYIMLGWGLNIVVGLAGMLDLGYVAFYAVGAYSFALLAEHFGLSFWICLPWAGILAAFWGVILGFPVLRLRGDYLAIVTLAFGEIIRIVLINWHSVTGGPDGITRIPAPTLFGLEFKAFGDNTFADYFQVEHASVHKYIFLFYLILVLALITNYITLRLKKLPLGRAWEALREDEIASRSLGVNTTTTKLTAFAIGAMFGGFAGAFFATKQTSITPGSFVFWESALILVVVVLGGMGSQLGVVIAAFAVVALDEALRNMDFLKQFFGDDFNPSSYRMLIFGIAMVAIMIWRPRGLISTRTPSIILKERKAIGGEHVKEGKG